MSAWEIISHFFFPFVFLFWEIKFECYQSRIIYDWLNHNENLIKIHTEPKLNLEFSIFLIIIVLVKIKVATGKNSPNFLILFSYFIWREYVYKRILVHLTNYIQILNE